MDPDLALVVGVFLVMFAFPAFVSAIADQRVPIVPVMTFVLAGGFIYLAQVINPNGYAWLDVPETFVRVVARYLM